MSGYRLPKGGLIDRQTVINAVFDGQPITGHSGDTLASAALASGVEVFGRSFKLHRPRGLIGHGLDEANAIVDVGAGDAFEPNLKATMVEMTDGLNARIPNAWPSGQRDMAAALAWFDRFLAAGFYYKTFKWPNWHLFEPMIRKMAGMGAAPESIDPDTYLHGHCEVDVLVIGAGTAGLTCSKVLAEAGANLLLVDQDNCLGGQTLWNSDPIEAEQPEAWRTATLDTIRSARRTQVLENACAVGIYDHGSVVIDVAPRSATAHRLITVRAQSIVLATGAIERPLLFENNDLPGIMLGSAGEAYAGRYGVASGQHVALAGRGEALHRRAARLDQMGVNITAIIDANKPDGHTDGRVFGGRVHRARGDARLTSLKLTGAGDVDCDSLLMTGGMTPNIHLWCHTGAKPNYDPDLHSFIADDGSTPAWLAGDAAARSGDAAAEDGRWVGYAVAAALSLRPMPDAPRPPKTLTALPIMGSPDDVRPNRVWVDFHNDVRVSDLESAADEGFVSVEHVKRYTTLGMATDQGRTSNVNAVHTLSDYLGVTSKEIGTTRFRPPFKPVRLGAMAGQERAELLSPLRRTAWHQAQLAQGAHFEDYANWSRASAFQKPGETVEAAIQREAFQVRKGVGLFDASPLGKIEVWGPDAADFLNRIYANTIKTLKPGKCRYGLMMSEHGVVFDDGICSRLSDDLFLVGTTSGNANRVYHWLEEWHQREWPELNVGMTNVTEQWATMAINGPNARTLLERLGVDGDISNEALPHMNLLETQITGQPARIFRVSFSGELCFEVSLPAKAAKSLWQDAMDAGADLEVLPFGIEALMVMRIEKGFLHIGSETDGETVPADIGFGRMVEKKKDDCVGRRSTLRPDALREDRRQMVGLRALNTADRLPLGAHIVNEASQRSQGWVSSSAASPTLNRWVGLAMLENGRSRNGESVWLYNHGDRIKAEICSPCALDPEGKRLAM